MKRESSLHCPVERQSIVENLLAVNGIFNKMELLIPLSKNRRIYWLVKIKQGPLQNVVLGGFTDPDKWTCCRVRGSPELSSLHCAKVGLMVKKCRFSKCMSSICVVHVL